MKVYHYSDKENIKILKPSFFGSNSWSIAENRACSIPRVFFYAKGSAVEKNIASQQYKYCASIPDNKIYDITKDKEGFLIGRFNIAEAIYYISKKYKYIKYNIGDLIIINSFISVKVKNA